MRNPLVFTGDWSGRKDGGGRTGNTRTESNIANIDTSSNSTERKKRIEQFILTKITGVVTVTEK